MVEPLKFTIILCTWHLSLDIVKLTEARLGKASASFDFWYPSVLFQQACHNVASRKICYNGFYWMPCPGISKWHSGNILQFAKLHAFRGVALDGSLTWSPHVKWLEEKFSALASILMCVSDITCWLLCKVIHLSLWHLAPLSPDIWHPCSAWHATIHH